MLIKTFSDQICRRMYVNVHANITYHICEALRIWTTEICCYNLSSPMMHCTFLCRKNKKDSAEVSSFVIQRRNPKLILVINPKPHAVFGHINLQQKSLNVMYITRTTEVSIYSAFTHVGVPCSFLCGIISPL